MKIILMSETLTISKVKYKTKAKMLEHLKVGDKIKLSVDASPVGSNRGTYAAYIEIKNIKTGETTQQSFNQIGVLYRTFDFTPNEEMVYNNN